MTAEKIKFLEDSINEVIVELKEKGGCLYVVDRSADSQYNAE